MQQGAKYEFKIFGASRESIEDRIRDDPACKHPGKLRLCLGSGVASMVSIAHIRACSAC